MLTPAAHTAAMAARGTLVEVVAQRPMFTSYRSLVAVKVSISRARAARRVLGERPAQKDCRFYWECDARRRHSPLPFASNGDVGTPRLEKQL